jgi:tetratricopeptide (TPR) repeat protein
MIVIGSHAARLRGIPLRRNPKDVDIVGTRQELQQFREANARYISEEKSPYEYRTHFHLNPGEPYTKVEFDCEGSPSDILLAQLCTSDTTRVLDSVAYLPNLNLLFLTKRAHINIPYNFEKSLSDVLSLKPHTTPFMAQELSYYKTRKAECWRRFKQHSSRFTLSVSNEEFFAVSNHIREYEHDDVHRAVAFTKGHPLFEQCKRDLNSAKIDRDLFEALPVEEQIRLPQEEFFVIGIERFYMKDRNLPKRAVYTKALVKTIRDLFTGWFQDFCLDNIEKLAVIPNHDFIGRFEEAERNGELRLLQSGAAPEQAKRKQLDEARQLFAGNRMAEAAALFRAVLEAAPPPGEPTAFYYLGLIAAKSGDNVRAEELIRRSLSIRDNFAEAWHSLGNVLRVQGKIEEALAPYSRAVEIKPAFFAAWTNFGSALEMAGQTDKALLAYRRALRINPQHPYVSKRVQGILQTRPKASAELRSS